MRATYSPHTSRIRPKLLDAEGCPIESECSSSAKKKPLPKELELDSETYSVSEDSSSIVEMGKIMEYRKCTFGSAARFAKSAPTWKHWSQKEQQEADDNIRNLVNEHLKDNPNTSKELLKIFSKEREPRSSVSRKNNSSTKKDPAISLLYNELIEECEKKRAVKSNRRAQNEIQKEGSISKPNCFSTDIKGSAKKSEFETPEASVVAAEDRANAVQESRIRSENKPCGAEVQKEIIATPLNTLALSDIKPNAKANPRYKFPHHKEKKLKKSMKARVKETLRDPTKASLINSQAAKKYLSELYIRVLYNEQKSSSRLCMAYQQPQFKLKSKMTVDEFHRAQGKAARIIQRAFRKYIKSKFWILKPILTSN
eukprot:TRINITY_DN11082_c0_g2_i2.p1 TRINITY_DN11082_c0_g2~~TRINITY_DN11082_c0_g2_i2.p1  ORF type:complete len:369 (-),score=66.12 TRINITY_DN11082_c0_g2_i2:200-1306(-)